jgi:hypothetical protein
MIQIAPERAAEIYKRGMDYGQSRVIVGAHWQTDVDNSRMAASLLFSVLQDNDDFQAMLGFHFPWSWYHGIVGLLLSLGFALLVVQVARLIVRWHIKVKI